MRLLVPLLLKVLLLLLLLLGLLRQQQRERLLHWLLHVHVHLHLHVHVHRVLCAGLVPATAQGSERVPTTRAAGPQNHDYRVQRGLRPTGG